MVGAELLGMRRVGNTDGTGGLEAVKNHGGIIVVLGDMLEDQDEDFGANAGLYVYLGTHECAATKAAHLVLPVSTYAEQEGTFTNHEGRVQRFWPALQPPGMARPAWLILGAVVAALAGETAPRTAGEAFTNLTEDVPALNGLSYAGVGMNGALSATAAPASAD